MKVSPLTIRVMLACYYSPVPFEEMGLTPNGDQMGKSEFEWLLDNRLIAPETKRATGKGNKWVEAILSVPLPVFEWRIPDD